MENFRLKVFRVVAAHLNFSRAAEELLLSQPAVTLQIRALEEELGVSLFDRQGGRIALTPGGRSLLPYAQKLKDISDEAAAAVASTSEIQAGSLSIGASQTIGQYLLPNLLAGFLRSNPRVAITVISGNSDQMLESLIAHKTQISLVEGPALRKDVHIEPFMEDQLVLAVPASHEWAGMEIGLDLLKSAPLLMREFGSGTRRVIESALAGYGIPRKDLRIRMELDSTEGLLNAVESGLGLTFVSQWAARNHLALGTINLAHICGLRLARNFSLAYPSGPAPSGTVAAFRAYLHAIS
ncbi:MAG: LysR substrate-binding domain-containing protein, partial [Terracidiphilus sp.]